MQQILVVSSDVMWRLSCKVNVASAVETELLAVMEVVSLVWTKGWRRLWLETDSSLVVHYFTNPKLVPWHLRVAWANCLHVTKHIFFHISHIFRERNSVADVLANYGAVHSGYQWWDTLPQFLVYSYGHDLSSKVSYHFS
jgi:ribonuclease HI